MKSLKKISVTLMLCFLVVFTIVSCNSAPLADDGKNESNKAAETALTGAFDCFKKFDLVGFSEYMVDGSSLKESGIGGMDDFIDYIVENSGYEQIFDMLGRENKRRLLDSYEDFFEDALGMIDYEIVECVEISEDTAVYKVKFTMPDFNSMDLSDALNYDMGYDFAKNLVDEGVITPDMSTEEQLEVAMSHMVDYIIEVLEEKLDEVELITETFEVKLVKVDGKWLLDEDVDSDIFSFMK